MATRRAASANEDVRQERIPAPQRDTGRRVPARRKRTRRAVRRQPPTSKGRTELQPCCASEGSDALRAQLSARVIGQDHAVDALVSSWARLLSGLRDPDRPLLTALLMGPTGVGKTETARALAAALFGSESALHRINCEEGKVTLGNNTTTDLTRSLILMTTNVGSREMGAAIGRVPLGFAASGDAVSDTLPLGEIAESAARQVFPVEFLNRFDETLVFSPLGSAELDLIFDKFLGAVNERAHEQAGVPLLIKTSGKAKSLVIEAGTDATLGARPLRRAIERLIVDPVSRLLACGQIGPGDVVEVEQEEGELRFYRLPRGTDKIVA